MGKEVNKKVSQLEIQIAEKFKNCSTYLAIREVKAKTTLRFYLSPTRMPKTKQNKTKQTLTNAGIDVRERNAYSLLVGGKTGYATIEIRVNVPNNLKIDL